MLALQDPIATALIGPADPGEAPLVGLTLPILLAFGAFFILGFLLYAFVYAAAGSLVSRPEDIQQLAMPLSFVSMAGYFAAIFGMTAINSRLIEILSFVPFFSPYVMLARVMLGHVEAWEVALSLVLLVASIAVSSWVAARIYGAGVLLYGQRPGFADLHAGRDPARWRLSGQLIGLISPGLVERQAPDQGQDRAAGRHVPGAWARSLRGWPASGWTAMSRHRLLRTPAR